MTRAHACCCQPWTGPWAVYGIRLSPAIYTAIGDVSRNCALFRLDCSPCIDRTCRFGPLTTACVDLRSRNWVIGCTLTGWWARALATCRRPAGALRHARADWIQGRLQMGDVYSYLLALTTARRAIPDIQFELGWLRRLRRDSAGIRGGRSYSVRFAWRKHLSRLAQRRWCAVKERLPPRL